MTTLLENLLSIKPKSNDFTQLDLIQGYNKLEIQIIEQRYNLSIHGQFKEFLMTMGKCSGGLILGSEISIFNNTYTPTSNYFGIQQQIDTQNDEILRDFLKERNVNLIKEQYFNLSYENEGMIDYFLLTNRKNNIVYYYDESLPKIQFAEYGTLFDLLISYRKKSIKQSKFWAKYFNENPKRFTELTMGRLL